MNIKQISAVGSALNSVSELFTRILIMSVIFIIGFPVVGGLRARDGEIFVRVDVLKHTHKHIITHSSRQGNESPCFH